MLWLRQWSRRSSQDYRRRWGWTVVGHWWTPGRCCSLLTRSLRGQEASGLLLASGEEAVGYKRWQGWGCRQSLPQLILKKVGEEGDEETTTSGDIYQKQVASFRIGFSYSLSIFHQ